LCVLIRNIRFDMNNTDQFKIHIANAYQKYEESFCRAPGSEEVLLALIHIEESIKKLLDWRHSIQKNQFIKRYYKDICLHDIHPQGRNSVEKKFYSGR
jgi:hypothetical protein